MSAQPVTAWDFTVAESGIVQRLKDRLQTGHGAWARQIGTRTELAAVVEEMQVVPAVYVVYNGFAVLSADECSAALAHRWFAVIAVSGISAQQREAAPRNQEAGPYMRDVLHALHGWQPPGCSAALVPATPPRPYYSPAKFAYYPLAFTTESYHCAALAA
jgi:hypothetical protein